MWGTECIQGFTAPYKDFPLVFYFSPTNTHFQVSSCLQAWAFWDPERQTDFLPDFIWWRASMLAGLANQLPQISPLLSIHLFFFSFVFLSLISFPCFLCPYQFKKLLFTEILMCFWNKACMFQSAMFNSSFKYSFKSLPNNSPWDYQPHSIDE